MIYIKIFDMIRPMLMLLLLVGCSLAAQAPVPFCNSRPIYKEGPLSYEQRLIHDMDDAFSGYNLDIVLASNNSFATMTRKFLEVDRLNNTFPNLIAHHIEHKGNDWGKEAFLLYKDNSGLTHFVYGMMPSSHEVPHLNFTVLVTTEQDQQCFGAALFLDNGLAVVDCVKKTTNASNLFQNFFVYLDLTQHTVVKKVNNAMFVRFTELTQRKLLRFTDPHTGYVYLLRAYEALGVDKDHWQNTYLEVFSARDPTDLQLLRVVDRTYIHAKTMSLADVRVYLGDIFLLDYMNGLYRLDIQRNQDIVITARYNKQGFSKFGVYSDDLENELIIALANQHAVYEIDWSNTLNPVTINKYSLIEHSHIRAVNLNDRYLLVQSSANATDSNNAEIELDYTWIFTKGSRTYMNAYHVIDHRSSKVEVVFNALTDTVLIADEAGLALYKLDQARITLQSAQRSRIGHSEDVIIVATSSDPHSKEVYKCQEIFTVHFVESTDQTIYSTGLDTTSKYSSNYPGELFIPLRNYMRGPNMTVTLTNTSAKHEIPSYWFNIVNETKIHRSFDLGKIIFFQTQVIPDYGEETLIYYIQDEKFATHVVTCNHVWESAEAYCSEAAKHNHTSKIHSFTPAFFEDQDGINYFYIMVFQNDLKTVHIVDLFRHESLLNITYIGHQEVQVTGVASSNGFLYVLRGNVKTVDVYRLQDCHKYRECAPDFKLDAETLKPLGVQYFAPLKIITDYMHPQVIFIQCIGSILIVDIDNKQRITVLDQIISPATQSLHFSLSVNKNTMVVLAAPNIADVYTLDNLYSKSQVKYMRRLPLYNYEIRTDADIAFSSIEDLIYVSAVSTNIAKSVILVYRPSSPAALSLYQVIPLDKIYDQSAMEVEVSGYLADFLSIKTDDSFKLYRVFENPMLAIKDTFLDFKFQIQFENSQIKHITQSLQVETVNYPDGFTPTKQLNKTLKNLQLGAVGNYTWEDRKWFTGHVLSYNYTCDQCGDKVKVREHVEQTGSLPITGFDFAQTLTGGVAVNQDLIKFYTNGSIHEVILLPDQKAQQRCEKIATAFFSQFMVTACSGFGKGVNLYVTTSTSFKSWTWGPYQSSAGTAQNMQIAGSLLMLTDSTQHPEEHRSKGGVYLYYLGFDKDSGEEMGELQFIDEDDLTMAHGYDKDTAYIANSYLLYDTINSIYRLYVTQVDSGLFVLDFTYQPGRFEINIVKNSFINIKELLEKNDLHMPSDGSFQAVTRIAYKYNPHFDTETILVVTRNYHNFEIFLAYDDSGNIKSSILHRIYYRYGYYQANNHVKAVNGYTAISYTLPSVFREMTNYTRQLVAVYDTSDYEQDHQKGYSQRYMLGAFPSNRTTPLVFAFNTTYDFHTNGTRDGLIVTSPFDSTSKNMYEISLSKNLTAQLKPDFKDQTLTFIPYSDFEVRSFSMPLVNHAEDDEELIGFIIISIAGVITVVFALYVCATIREKKKKDQKIKDERSSLLTEGSLRETIEPQEGHKARYEPPVQEKLDPGSVGDDEEEDGANQEREQLLLNKTDKEEKDENVSKEKEEENTKPKEEKSSEKKIDEKKQNQVQPEEVKPSQVKPSDVEASQPQQAKQEIPKQSSGQPVKAEEQQQKQSTEVAPEKKEE